MSRLNCYVYVTGPDGGVRGFGPESDLPDWAREKITNPHVWDTPPEPVVVGKGGGGGEAVFDPLPTGGGSGSTVEIRPMDGPPPQGGTGATRQRWADYASAKGVEVDADWKREDIIAACEKAGIPV
ncbi:hypothetical protein [Nocardia wallacei]|uniref:hypothetical protein n=1 Tax=Nocardia wallacei TaxID=480035 RepID=UPI002454548D|nr:hypothetical protein [Nocardia wallacei]